jgi:hypothetical protein
MDRTNLEAAITSLRALLSSGEEKESAYQAWCERNPVVFEVLNYVRFLPHPRLRCPERDYIPDFMAMRVDGLWDVVEIKTPATAILRHSERRRTFYATFTTYLAQCREYSEFFDDSANREAFRSVADLQKRPNATIIAGRSRGVDIRKIHELLAGTVPHVSFMTYDDLWTLLEQARKRMFGKYEGASGWSFHLVFVQRRLGGIERFVFDVGITEDRNRISVFFDRHGDLVLRVRAEDGRSHAAAVQRGSATFDYDTLTYVALDVATGDDSGLLTIEVNGVYRAESKVGPLSLNTPLHFVVGSDLFGTAPSSMDLVEKIVFNKIPAFEEKVHLRGYFFAKYRNYWNDPLSLPGRVQFEGNQFLHSDGHPLHAKGQPQAGHAT